MLSDEESPLLPRTDSKFSPEDQTTTPPTKDRNQNLVFILACVWGGTFLAALGKFILPNPKNKKTNRSEERKEELMIRCV